MTKLCFFYEECIMILNKVSMYYNILICIYIYYGFFYEDCVMLLNKISIRHVY